MQWVDPGDAMPPPMVTVLVVPAGDGEPSTAYWDGDEWYSTEGEPIAGVLWWTRLPAVPGR